MVFKYLPSLKAKKGELSALQSLSDPIKSQICPLLEIPAVDWSYVKDAPAKTIKSHLSSVIEAIEAHWQNSFFVDFSSALQIMASEESQDILTLFDQIAQDHSIAYIPVIDFDRSTSIQYRETSKVIHSRQNCGICLRVKYSDLEDVVEESKYSDLLSNLNLAEADVDLILDFGSINSFDSDKTLYLATRLVLMSVPNISLWRSVTVLASSFPFSLSDVPKNTEKKLPRREWLSWKRLLAKQSRLERMPTYGDYSISHPELVEIDPRVMSMSAAIRYSTPEDWLILKGESIKISGFAQFPKLSRDLVRLPEYSGSEYSEGDRLISEYANSDSTKTGNATTWRKIGNNHHFTLVVNELSNLLAT